MHKTLRLTFTALSLLGAALPSGAFNPQPDPPAKLIWQNIDLPGALNTFAYGINNAGQIAGYTDDGITAAYGYVRNGNTVTTYSVPGSYAIYAENYAINAAGDVAGAYYTLPGALYGFQYSGGFYQQVDPGGLEIFAFGLNDAGQMVGRNTDTNNIVHGWLWNGHAFSSIDHPGAVRTVLNSIDNAGRIVGTWVDP